MNNSWRRTKVKRHFPWSPSAQPFPEVRSEARVCVLPLSPLGNKRHSHGLQLGRKDMRNPGTCLGQTPVKTYCQPGFTACSSGQQQSPSQLSKRRMDWGNCCSSLDCKFFKIDLSVVVDGCGWLMVAKESNRPAQSHLMWLCTSFQDFSLKIYFCKWFANLKKDPNELFFNLGFSHGTRWVIIRSPNLGIISRRNRILKAGSSFESVQNSMVQQKYIMSHICNSKFSHRH